MNPKALFEQLIEKRDLSPDQMQAVLQACLEGLWSDAQIASFLALMRMKGESVTELASAAKTLIALAEPLDLQLEAIDIVGTGGDGRNTFNVSTAASFVVAGAGIKVAKHGNRSVSSRSGAADLLEQAGIALHLKPEQVNLCLEQANLVFLFAPHYHPALQKVRAARQALGLRTFFNLLGPLLNPARVKRQVVGVFASLWQQPLAEVLGQLGAESALVVHAEDGLDELSIAAPTTIVEYRHGQIKTWVLNPKDYGLAHKDLEAVCVTSPEQSLQLINQVLEGAAIPARDLVLLNAAAALYCAQDGMSFEQALEQARQSLDSGQARHCFTTLRTLSQSFKQD